MITEFAELNEEQRRRLIDVRQVFEAWRTADAEFRHSYRGSMRWRRINAKDYLYRISGKVEHSLGPRNAATEQIKSDYTDQRGRLKRRLTVLDKRLTDMERMNRAAGLGRVPVTAARILRKLDAEGLLGRHLFVVGTHALFAYEAASGVVFDAGLTATGIDLLWDARRRLSLALIDARAEGVLGLLRKVDRSFCAQRNSFRAINDGGYYVDLLRPLDKDEARSAGTRIGEVDDDLEAAALTGLHWLINAPKFEQTVVGADGRTLWMSSVDPRVFALHKCWISTREDRDPVKRRRDIAQAKAVAAVATQYPGLAFKAKELSALPVELVQAAESLLHDSG